MRNQITHWIDNHPGEFINSSDFYSEIGFEIFIQIRMPDYWRNMSEMEQKHHRIDLDDLLNFLLYGVFRQTAEILSIAEKGRIVDEKMTGFTETPVFRYETQGFNAHHKPRLF